MSDADKTMRDTKTIEVDWSDPYAAQKLIDAAAEGGYKLMIFPKQRVFSAEPDADNFDMVEFRNFLKDKTGAEFTGGDADKPGALKLDMARLLMVEDAAAELEAVILEQKETIATLTQRNEELVAEKANIRIQNNNLHVAIETLAQRNQKLVAAMDLSSMIDYPAQILRTYIDLHEGKIGMHWFWAAIERMASGEDVEAVFADYGWRKEPPQEESK